MDDSTAQLTQYVRQTLSQGMPAATVRAQLIQSGWPQPQVDSVLQVMQPELAPRQARSTKAGVLWLISPFVVLIANAIIEASFHAAGINSLALNIVSLLLGMAGIVLLPVGISIGIIKLTRG